MKQSEMNEGKLLLGGWDEWSFVCVMFVLCLCFCFCLSLLRMSNKCLIRAVVFFFSFLFGT